MASDRQGDDAKLPEHVNPWPGLYRRQDGKIVEALPQDVVVARGYPAASRKGAVVRGRRITVMCGKDTYYVGEEVRVIHVLEILEPGQEIFVMGPKPVRGEYVDGREMEAAAPEGTEVYDGRVLESPAVDYNYDVTTYRFDAPGHHEIRWQMGELRSNTLELEVVRRRS